MAHFPPLPNPFTLLPLFGLLEGSIFGQIRVISIQIQSSLLLVISQLIKHFVDVSPAVFLDKFQGLAFVDLNDFELFLALQISKDDAFVVCEFDSDDKLFVADESNFRKGKILRVMAGDLLELLKIHRRPTSPLACDLLDNWVACDVFEDMLRLLPFLTKST